MFNSVVRYEYFQSRISVSQFQMGLLDVFRFFFVCSKPLQLKMAKYCEEVFGDLLLSQPMDSHPVSQQKRMQYNFLAMLLVTFLAAIVHAVQVFHGNPIRWS